MDQGEVPNWDWALQMWTGKARAVASAEQAGRQAGMWLLLVLPGSRQGEGGARGSRLTSGNGGCGR